MIFVLFPTTLIINIADIFEFLNYRELKKKFVYIFILILVGPNYAFSQKVLSGNLYYQNNFLLNPAYTGSLGFLTANIHFRQTAASIKGAPVMLGFSLQSPIYKNMNLGTHIHKQSEGLFNTITAYADYAYHIKLNKEQSLKFGLSAGIKSNKINNSEIIAEDPGAIIDIASRSYEGTYFETAAGFVYSWKDLEFSFSIPQLFETKKTFEPYYCSFLSYNMKPKLQNLSLKPYILTTYIPKTPILYDVGLSAIWKEQYYVGITYRNRPGIILSTGLNFDKISFSYAIEFGLQKQSNIFNQVHEISLSYAFGKIKPTPKDTITEPIEPLIAKSDSLKNDTLQHKTQDYQVIADSTKKYTDKETKTKYRLVQVSKGIWVMKRVDTDSINQSINQQDYITEDKKLHLLEDSVLTNHLIEKIDKSGKQKPYRLVDLGDGNYTIQWDKHYADSVKLTDSQIDSIIFADNLLEKIKVRKNESDTNLNNNEQYIYSIQLFINELNKDILRNAEIAIDTWIEVGKDGILIYYYGRFKTLEEAQEKALKLNQQYSNLTIKVLKLFSNQ